VCPAGKQDSTVEYPQFGLLDLSPVSSVSEDELFVILKGYFDGGNRADSTRYNTVTLACLFGGTTECKVLEDLWAEVREIHRAPPLHTTDLMALQGDFSTGWDAHRRDDFLNGCVTAIDKSIVRESGNGIAPGIALVSITVDLKDFKKYQSIIPDGPQDATEVCSVQSFYKMIECGELFGAHFYHLYFDRSEPFRGHFVDRVNNRRFRRELKEFDFERRIRHIGESSARDVPALQAADLLAWCAGHQKVASMDWHLRLLDINHESEWIDKTVLCNPSAEMIAVVNKSKLPRRKPTP
jgi:hypothetical protein